MKRLNTVLLRLFSMGVFLGLCANAWGEYFPGLFQYWYTANSVDINKDFEDIGVNGPDRTLGCLAAEVKSNTSATFTNPLSGDSVTIGNNTCVAYEGEIYLDATKTYTICGSFDDWVYVVIDGVQVFKNNAWNDAGVIKTYTPASTGWYSFKAFFQNGGGGIGYSGGLNVLSSLMWTTSEDTAAINNTSMRNDATLWKRFEDPGDMSFLRVDKQASEIRTLTVATENAAVVRAITPGPGTREYMTFQPRQKQLCTALETIADGAYSWVLDGYAIQTSEDDCVTWSAPVTNLAQTSYTYQATAGVDERITWIYHREDLRPVFTASGETSLADAAKWSTGAVPETKKGIDVVIHVTDDAVIQVPSTLVLRDVTIIGEGTVEFVVGADVTFQGCDLTIESGVTFIPAGNVVFDTTLREGSTLLVADDAMNLSALAYNLLGGSTLQLDVVYTGNTIVPQYRFQGAVDKPVLVTGTGSLKATKEKCRVAAACINPEGLVRDQEITLVTNELADGFEADDFHLTSGKIMGPRFNKPVVTATKVSATVVDGRPANRLHYDFEGDNTNAKGGMAAMDSGRIWTSISGNNAVFGPSLEGQAVLLSSSTFAPQFFAAQSGTYTSDSGTLVCYLRPMATDKRFFFTFGSGDTVNLISLVVENENTISVLSAKHTNAGGFAAWGGWIPLATVTGISDMTTKEHFIAVKFDAYGTTLRVDNLETKTTNVAPVSTNNGSGQIASCRMGNPGGYSEQPATDGCWLGDIQIYDAVLTDLELQSIWSEFDDSQLPSMTAFGTASFENSGAWNTGAVPSGGEIKITIAGDTQIQLSSAKEFVRIFLNGSGNVTFTGAALTTADIVANEGVVYAPRAGEVNRITINDGAAVDLKLLAGGQTPAVRAIGTGVDGSGAIFNSAATSAENPICLAGLTLMGDTTIDVTAGKDWGVVGTAEAGATFKLEMWNLTKEGNGNFTVADIASASRGHLNVTDGTLTMGTFAYEADNSSFLYNGIHVTIAEGKTVYYRNEAKATGIRFYMQPGSTFDIAHSAVVGNMPGLLLQPSESAPVTLTGTGDVKAYYSSDKLRVEAAFLDYENIAADEEITLVVNETAKDFEANDIRSTLGARFNAATVSAREVKTTLTEGRIANRYHYDFEGAENAWENVKGGAVAEDSTMIWSISDNTANACVEEARGGQAILVSNQSAYKFRPTTFDNSAHRFWAGVGTITMVMRPLATDKRVVYSMGPGDVLPLFMLVVENETTMSVIGYEYFPSARANAQRVYARVTGIKNLTTKEHFVAVKFDGRGTTLIVDNLENTTTNPVIVPQSASSSLGYCRQADNLDGYTGFSGGSGEPMGYWLNDFQLYDAVLTDAELDRIKNGFWPTGSLMILR